ncbi:hypothetical protein BDA96_07G014300 [Sorghum bicolor]|uniref:Uncharacterized protein n=1 Tax=Sorghum bicolor TaxID=4558 RepID=A0A921U908_SORBI|nr:hypothetical protein BDA96_07G014300 [Sorghum bicolor]
MDDRRDRGHKRLRSHCLSLERPRPDRFVLAPSPAGAAATRSPPWTTAETAAMEDIDFCNHNSTEGGHGNILDGATKVDIHAWDAIREHRHLPSLSGCLSGACGGGRDCSCCNGGRWYPHGGPAVTVRPPRPLRPSSLARSHSRHSRSIDARSILV